MLNVEAASRQVCEFGRRMYAKNFCVANEGNLSVRIAENKVLCTPTLICKGYMEAEDLCLVDLNGKQLAGTRHPTSEILMHLEIYRRRADIQAVLHAHPPHATAFTVAREPVPTGVLAEPDILLGAVPLAPYATTGTQALADSIVPYLEQARIIMLANHGTVALAHSLERAFWYTEILDSYCRILLIAKQLGRVESLSAQEANELAMLHQTWSAS